MTPVYTIAVLLIYTRLQLSNKYYSKYYEEKSNQNCSFISFKFLTI